MNVFVFNSTNTMLKSNTTSTIINKIQKPVCEL